MFASYTADDILSSYHDKIPGNIYNKIEKAFKLLYGVGNGGQILKNTELEGYPILTEENFKRNLGQLTGYDCPFFGKLLYLYFAKGFDQVKITMQRFFEALIIYVDHGEK